MTRGTQAKQTPPAADPPPEGTTATPVDGDPGPPVADPPAATAPLESRVAELELQLAALLEMVNEHGSVLARRIARHRNRIDHPRIRTERG